MIFNIIFTGDKMKFESYEICSTGIKSICKTKMDESRQF
jgi:hypothetical protein